MTRLPTRPNQKPCNKAFANSLCKEFADLGHD